MAAPVSLATHNKSVNKVSSIEEALFKKGRLTQEQLSFIQNEARRRQETSEKIIRSMKWVTEEELAEGKAEVLGVEYYDPTKHPISPEILTIIPEDVAKKFTIIPVKKEGSVISVAMVDPLDLQAVEFIEKKSEQRIRPLLATAASIEKAIAEQYTKGLASEVTAALKEVAPGVGKSFVEAKRQSTGSSKVTIFTFVEFSLDNIA